MIAFLIEVVKSTGNILCGLCGAGYFISGLCSGQRSWLGGKKTEQREARTGGQRGMKAEFFKAVCPLEIGDTVAIKATKDGETKEALYLPQGCTVITTAAVALHKVTDIATLHYLKKGETQFLYELDGCGKYEPLTVKVPVREFADELKRRGR